MSKHVLVAGAGGIVGNAALDVFSREEGCRVTTVARRAPFDAYGAHFVSVDLLDDARCEEVFSQMTDVTHVVFAAVVEFENIREGWTDPSHVEINTRLLRNLLGPLERNSSKLRHVSIIHGAKAYGTHRIAAPVPTREGRDEIRSIPNFYWGQEDYIRELQQGKDWNWTIFRPNYIFGFAPTSPLNLLMLLGVYAAVQKARGEPFHYTGGSKMLSDATDSELLAQALLWAGENEAAANEIFNVTNGDLFSWPEVWPCLARAYGLEPGDPQPASLQEMVPVFEKEWGAIQQRYDLQGGMLGGVEARGFGWLDRSLAYGFDRALPTMFMSNIKIRQAGFHNCIDTEKMFEKWIRRHQEARFLPPAA